MNFRLLKFKVLLPLLSLLILSMMFLTFANIWHWKFSYHLAATFLEIFLSIIIIELYFGTNKRKETLKIYSLTRHYIYERVMLRFKKVFDDVIDFSEPNSNLGELSSVDVIQEDVDYFKKIAIDILNNLNDDQILEIIRTIKNSFSKLEDSANLNMVYHNRDLFLSLTILINMASMIRQLDEDKVPNDIIIDVVRTDKHLDMYVETPRLIFIQFIATWLYIVNNFIFYSEVNSDILRNKFINYSKNRKSINL